MRSNVQKFRHVKNGQPREKPAVPAEDFQQRSRLDDLSPARFVLLTAGAASLAFGTVMALSSFSLPDIDWNRIIPRSAYDPACNIKGNISINSGEHIYHIPGQKDYASTRISSEHGERWFCSEAEARAAGWRKAGR